MRQSVLIVGNFLSATPNSRSVCEELAERLALGGWSVITASDKPGRVARLLDMLRTAWGRRHEYAVAQVDVYSGRAFIWAEATCRVLRQAGKPYVLTLHGGNLPAFARRWPGRVRRLLRSAAVVTTPSGYLQEQMREYRSDLYLLPNPLEIGAYPFRLRDRPRPRLVWLRAFHRIYNPPLAARTIALLQERFPDIHLTMVGPDKGDGSLQSLKQAASELGVDGRIDLPGGVAKADVPQWLNKGDIFLNTTNFDNMPVSVMEAMACGLCVVSTSVGGVPYLLTHEEDALLVPPDDAEAMAYAVERVLTEPDLAGRLSEKARARVAAFDWAFILPRWERLLEAVATGETDSLTDLEVSEG